MPGSPMGNPNAADMPKGDTGATGATGAVGATGATGPAGTPAYIGKGVATMATNLLATVNLVVSCPGCLPTSSVQSSFMSGTGFLGLGSVLGSCTIGAVPGTDQFTLTLKPGLSLSSGNIAVAWEVS